MTSAYQLEWAFAHPQHQNLTISLMGEVLNSYQVLGSIPNDAGTTVLRCFLQGHVIDV